MKRIQLPHKQQVLQDIKPTGAGHFAPTPRINLSRTRFVRVPLVSGLKIAMCLFAVWIWALGSATAPTAETFAANNDAERQALETQLQGLESQINQYQDQVSGYQKQGSSLKNEVTILNTKIAKLNLEIKAINLSISELDHQITDTQTQIGQTQASIDTEKKGLGVLLQKLHESEQTSIVEVFLASKRFSDVFNDLTNLSLLQNSVRTEINRITDLRTQLQGQKDQLSLARADEATTKSYQESQKSVIDQTKQEKNQLLTITKGQESKYQALLQQTKETAAQIRSRIFQLFGGGEMSFGDAYKIAKIAGNATGLSPAFLLAILDRESALGQNVGKCTYQVAMNPKDQPVFLALLSALSISPTSVSVSCPNRDGAYGGAMGPAQFIPSTWSLYSDKVSQVTGNSPANPWNNSDAFAATALYLKDAMASCSAAYGSLVNQERCTAARYYAGSRWRSYLWTYGEAVVSRAKSFEGDIATLNQ